MSTFDTAAAKAAGYSDAEIQQFMAQQQQTNSALSHPAGLTQQPYPGANDPTEGMGPASILAASAGRGIVHGAKSIGNWVGAVPDSAMADEKAIDAPLMRRPGADLGNIVGESALTAPITMGVSGALGQAARVPLLGPLGRAGAAVARNPIANQALQGGLQGAITSDPGERGFNSAMGAVTGGGLATGGSIVSKIANGLTTTPAARTLLSHGISLTPGQLNPGGVINQGEQALRHVWGVGPMIESARDNAEHQFQARAIQMGAAPGTTITPSENIHEMLQQAYDSYAPLYSQAHGYPVSPKIMRANGPDVPLDATFKAAAQAPGVPRSLQQSENDWLQDRLTQLGRNPHSEDLLQLRSDIRQRARNANLKTDTDSGHVANINSRAERGVTAAFESQLPQQPLDALRTADSNYGNYKIIENAVAKSKDNLAGMTPAKLSQAISNATADPQYARGGGGPLRDMAQAGTNVFQTVVPPNGATVATLGGLAGAGYMHPVATGVAGTGLLGLTLSPTGRRLAAGMTAPQQGAQALMAALQRPMTSDARRTIGALLARGGTGAALPYAPAAIGNASSLAAALMSPQQPKPQ